MVEGPIYHVEVSVGETDMPGVDGMLAMESIQGELDVLATDPDREAIENGEYEDTFAVFVTGAQQSAVEAAMAA
ncbi:MAG: chemotaxis protein CheA, partial [Halapricum sp.]